MNAPTLADVARAAGVSATTVSNVLRGRGRTSPATAERIRTAADAVGYRVNEAGRGLSSGRTGRVAIVVPMLYQPYFSEVAERLILALGEHGLGTTLRIAPDHEAELAAVMGATTPDVDGVIICPHAFNGADLPVEGPPRPVVQLGGGPSDRLDCVVMGEREGARAVAGHLLDRGRRRLAVVWHGDVAAPGGDRWEGYREALAERGLDLADMPIVAGSDWDRRMSGYEAMLALLRAGEPFDAALCVNDAIAVGVLRALRSHGRRVPQDVALVGFDDTAEGAFTTPSLTSVNPRKEEMVAAAVGMLLERLGGYAGPGRRVDTGADLVVRDSSA